MRARFGFVVGFAAGYVLGSKAGRRRYEQISSAARTVRNNPKVQEAAGKVQHQAADAISTAKDKASSAIGDRLHGHSDDPWSSATGSGADTGMEADWAGSNGHVRS